MKILPIDINGEKRIWRRGKDVIDEMYERGDLWYQKTRFGDQIYFKFRGGLDGGLPQKPLIEQWRMRLSSFLGLDLKDIGQIGGGKNTPNGILDIAMIQSMERIDGFIIDSLKKEMKNMKARYDDIRVKRGGHPYLLSRQ